MTKTRWNQSEPCGLRGFLRPAKLKARVLESVVADLKELGANGASLADRFR
jgi:hypothetical protein